MELLGEPLRLQSKDDGLKLSGHLEDVQKERWSGRPETELPQPSLQLDALIRAVDTGYSIHLAFRGAAFAAMAAGSLQCSQLQKGQNHQQGCTTDQP